MEAWTMGWSKGHWRKTRGGGMTFVRGHYRASSAESELLASAVGALIVLALKGALVFGAIAVVVWFVQTTVAFVRANATEIGIFLATSGALLTAVAVALIRKRVAMWRLARAAITACVTESTNAEQLSQLAKARRSAGKLTQSVQATIEAAHRVLVSSIVDDGVVEDAELERLQQTEDALQLSATAKNHGRLHGFSDVYHAAIEDGELTEREDEALQHISKRLGISKQSIRAELAFIEQLRRARDVREGDLVACEVDAKLQRGEQAYRVVAASEEQRGGGRREGRLMVTNRRMLFLSDGLTTVPYAKILDISVLPAEGELIVIVDGRKTPRRYWVDEPFVLMALVQRAASMGVRREGELGAPKSSPASGSAGGEQLAGASLHSMNSVVLMAGGGGALLALGIYMLAHTGLAPSSPAKPAASALGDVMNLLRRTRAAVWVSSKVGERAYGVGKLVDGKLSTAWNAKRGELTAGWIAFDVPTKARITSIRMTAGFTAVTKQHGDLFTKNYRVTKVSLWKNAKRLRSYSLDPNNRRLQALDLGASLAGGTYRISVDRVLAGSKRKWREVCVSELEVLGRVPRELMLAADTPPALGVGRRPARPK
ncbi:MAG: hypothetical protein KC503_00810 [Myxococcales bacterium]|nr:hypothetical protein [Myxococcales bacterium]